MNISDYKYCGFRRIAAIVPDVRVGDSDFNCNAITDAIAEHRDCDIIVFPELSITGYTCADLFGQSCLLDASDSALLKIRDFSLSEHIESCIVVGAPLRIGPHLYNCAVFICNGKILGAIPKTYIPNYSEYYELRWFSSPSRDEEYSCNMDDGTSFPVGTGLLFKVAGVIVSSEICEDLWAVVPPSCTAAVNGAEIILNLSASNETIGKHRYRRSLIAQQSARCRCIYAYTSAGTGESSTDVVFPGYAAICADGSMLAESSVDRLGNIVVKSDVDIEKIRHDRLHCNTFAPLNIQRGYRIIKATTTYHPENLAENLDEQISLIGLQFDRHPFVPDDLSHKDDNCTEIVRIQCLGLMQRLRAINCKDIVIGVSGGLDSTLALLVACRAFDMLNIPRTGIHAITMPGLATTSKTRNNAWKLMERLGCDCIEIPIGAAIDRHFQDIGQDPDLHDATYENSQARERTQILMDYANKTGGIVLGTGDLSELALGWCTYNGDHMSMYGINASVPKTLVRHLVDWFAARSDDSVVKKTLIDIINTPISPELVPAKEGDEIVQKTEDLVGPYELHDFFLFYMLRYGFSPRKIYIIALEAFEGIYASETILKWEKTFYRRFFNQQFKRSCMPDGPKVGSVCLSPRGDWRMPSDATARVWLEQLNRISN